MITDIQKASVLKRIAAGIFDGILICIFAVGFAWLLTSILNYNSYYTVFQDGLSRYEQQYGVDFDADYSSLSESQKDLYETAYKAVNEDADLTRSLTVMMNLTLLCTTFGIFLAIMVLEFAIPLWLKNGQTIGKKIFGIGLVRVDGVQMNHMQLFVRTVLGKFTIEIMIPVYIIIMIIFNAIGVVGILVLGGIVLLQLILIIATSTNSLIHDTMAGTVAIDFSSQMIFRTTEDLIAYKKKIHAEQAARSNYK